MLVLPKKARNGTLLVTIPTVTAAKALLPYVLEHGINGQLKALRQFVDKPRQRLYLRLRMPNATARRLIRVYVQIDWSVVREPVILNSLVPAPMVSKVEPKEKPSGPDAQLAADLALPTEELDLTIRAYNCLKREGINTVDDLTKRTETDLWDIRNFGQKSIDEVKMKLAGMGLGLEPERVPIAV